ncbi:MAG: DUF1232 domain-containing protein [Kineosporiaceae bacterium]|jgi:uncharacterized membrane protein YkvA (DUF1232 family)
MAVGRVAAVHALWRVLARRGTHGGVGRQLAAVPRMLRAGVRGRYPQLDRGRIVLILLALGYVVSPVDLVPEVLLSFPGLADDAVVLTWAVGALLGETEAFLAWERAGDQVVTGEVVE